MQCHDDMHLLEQGSNLLMLHLVGQHSNLLARSEHYRIRFSPRYTRQPSHESEFEGGSVVIEI